MCRQFDHLHAIHRLPVIVRLALKEIKTSQRPLCIQRDSPSPSFFSLTSTSKEETLFFLSPPPPFNFAIKEFQIFFQRDNYPRAIILSRLHHQRRARRVRLMSGESGYGRRVYAHARRVQGYGLLSTTVRCARNLWTDYARRVFDNLCIGWQAYTS